MAILKPSTPTSRTTGISSASIATGANWLGAEINNATNNDPYADIEITWSYASAPTAAKKMDVYLLYAMDGTNYEQGAGDGTGTGDVDPLAGCLIGSVSPSADTTAHRKVIATRMELLAYPFKILVANVDTAQTATVTVLCKTYYWEST